MTAEEILSQLASLGQDSVKRVLINHGVQEPVFGVKIEELKKIQKQVKQNHPLALALYATGNYDAMYLAGLIVDDRQMSPNDLRNWAETATSRPLRSSTVAWVAAESLHGREIALEWIDAPNEILVVTGWATYASLVAIKPDSDLDMEEIEGLLARVGDTIHEQANDVRSVMNDFVISVGTSVAPLHSVALETAEKIGAVTVVRSGTACKVPFAPDYIRKAITRGSVGKKRKSAKC